MEPYTLEEINSLCYGKFSFTEYLEAEREVRDVCGYLSESVTIVDFTCLFLKLLRAEFCDFLDKTAEHKVGRISLPSLTFFKRLSQLALDFNKLAILDPWLKRYLKSYVASCCIILAFDRLIDECLEDTLNKQKLDLQKV